MKKGQNLSENNIKLIQFLATLGIKGTWISKHLKINVRTVSKYVSRLNLADSEKPSKLSRNVFPLALRKYIKNLFLDNLSKPEVLALKKWLELDIIEKDFVSKSKLLKNLIEPDFGTNSQGYLGLLSAIFPKKSIENDFEAYLMSFFRCRTDIAQAIPRNHDEFMDASSKYLVSSNRKILSPIWPSNASEQIDEILSIILNSKEIELLEMYHGINQESMSFREIARIKKLAYQAIQQKYEDIIEKINTDSTRESLKHLWTILQVDEFQGANHYFKKESCYVLSWKVEGILISRRAKNALRKANILTVADLVKKTESELMFGIRNFGESCLHEVKLELARYGYSLGMELS